jgi:hypothetical protein
MKALVISGEFGRILARQKSSEPLELGELVVADSKGQKMLLQVTDLLYGSQLSQANLELISGIELEENHPASLFDEHLRSYRIAALKSLITLNGSKAHLSKTLPAFLSGIREVSKEDLSFMTAPKDPLFMGSLRSGSRSLDLSIFLPGKDVLSHHILVAATTGRGKSNLTSCLLWDATNKEYCGMLVLDPHDEYYGRSKLGLKDHPKKEKVVYYSPNDPPPGCSSLRFNLDLLKPHHFDGVCNFSDPQRQALGAYYKKFKKKWIEAIILDKDVSAGSKQFFHEGTLAVVRRRLMHLLDLDFDGEQLFCNGVFVLTGGQSTVPDICTSLESACTVILDTSSFSGEAEILVGSIISAEILRRYKGQKFSGGLKDNRARRF